MQNHKIYAVVVTYFPELKALDNLISTLKTQVLKVVIVDNTPYQDDADLNDDLIKVCSKFSVHLIKLDKNLGVAKALNLGIEFARSENAEYVLLSDQDSMPENNMVANLYQVFQELSKQNHKVAAIGPLYIDTYTNCTKAFHVKSKNRIFYKNQLPTLAEPHINTLNIITSGSLIPINVLDEVGGMVDELFIDYVDIEWCLRAKSKGYSVFGTCKAKMYQHLGEDELKFWLFGWHSSNLYSPLRLYYQVRNLVYLSKLDFVPISYKIRNAVFMVGKILKHVLFGKYRLKTIYISLFGFYHGLINKMGSIESA